MNDIFKEFLFKLDIIAPGITLLFIGSRWMGRGYRGSFSNRILVAYLVLELCLNAVAGYLHYKTLPNLWVYQLNCQLTHLAFTIYFFRALKRNRIVVIGFSFYLIANLILLFSRQLVNLFPSYSYAASSFILVVYALTQFNKLIAKIPTIHILSLKEFWLNTGILTYFGSAFLIFISYQYLSNVSPKNVYILWQVHNIFLALSCITFAKAVFSRQWIHR